MMTLETALVTAAGYWDACVVDAFDQARVRLAYAGFPSEDIETILAKETARISSEREQMLARLSGWLQRGGETLQ